MIADPHNVTKSNGRTHQQWPLPTKKKKHHFRSSSTVLTKTQIQIAKPRESEKNSSEICRLFPHKTKKKSVVSCESFPTSQNGRAVSLACWSVRTEGLASKRKKKKDF